MSAQRTLFCKLGSNKVVICFPLSNVGYKPSYVVWGWGAVINETPSETSYRQASSYGLGH